MSVPYEGDIEGIRAPSEVIGPDGLTRARASRSAAQALICELDLDAQRELHALRMHDRRPDTYGALTESK